MLHKTTAAISILSLILLASSGCDKAESLFAKSNQTKMTKAEIKRAIIKCRKDLPHRLDENFTLTKITMDYGGTINGWYTVSDELTAKLRRIGNLKIEEQMKKNIEELDLEASNAPDELVAILEQDSYALQYILEDKYGLPLASVVLSKETIDGDTRVGRSQENPFAVRTVSEKGGK